MARVLAFVGILVATAVAFSQEDPQVGSAAHRRPVVLTDCAVRAILDAKIPARQPGQIIEVNVKEMTAIKKGQVIAKLDDRLARVEAEAKRKSADNSAPLQEALAKEKEAGVQLEEAKRLRATNTIGVSELRLKEAQLEIAKYGADDEKSRLEQAKLAVDAADLQVQLHEIVAPFDGVVIQQLKHLGEAVQNLEPVVRLMRTDIVKIEGNLSVRDLDRVQKDMPIEVYPQRELNEQMVFRGHTAPVNDVKLLPDGRHIASAGADGVIIVWSIENGQRILALSTPGSVGIDNGVNRIAVAAHLTNHLISGGVDKQLRVWNLKTGAVAQSIDTGSPIGAIVVHPKNSSLVFTGHEDRTIRLWNLKSGELVNTFNGHSNHVTSLAVTPDGSRLISAADDRSIRVWDAEKAQTVRTFLGRSTEMKRIGINAEGTALLFNFESVVQARTIADDRPLGIVDNFGKPLTSIAVFTPVEGLILTVDKDRLQLWQLGGPNGQPRLVRTYHGHSGQSQSTITSVDFSADGDFFVSAGEDQTIRLWGLPTRKEIDAERKVGKVFAISGQAEGGGGTVTLIAEIDNRDGKLRPGMLSTMVVFPDRPMEARAAGN